MSMSLDHHENVAAPAGPNAAARPSEGYWRRVLVRLRRDRTTLAAALVILILLLLSLMAPLITFYDPTQGNVLQRLKPLGTAGHWLGTDEVGRDMWTRLAYGGRYTLFTGIVPVIIATVIGGMAGIAAGIGGRTVNTVIMRTMDVFYAFPSILLAVAIAGVLGGGVRNTIVSLTLVFIPPITRVTESVTVQINGLDFVDAARATGARASAIIWHQIIPNVLGPIGVFATSLISMSIILAAGLSFLGLGVKPPQAEWGLMLNSMRQGIYISPIVAILPGVMIFLTSVSFNVLSDGLRAAMDVRLHK